MLVRHARESEYAAVGALTVAGYDAEGYLRLPDGSFDDAYASWLGDAANRGRDGDLMVAVDGDDDLLGTATWCPPGSPFREVSTHDHQGEFRTLSVSPQARRRGVARLLVLDCVRRAHELGLTEMVLCSLPEMTPAHGLYASVGFTRRPDLDWSPASGIVLWGFAADLTAQGLPD